jgi:hypothetical protein
VFFDDTAFAEGTEMGVDKHHLRIITL